MFLTKKQFNELKKGITDNKSNRKISNVSAAKLTRAGDSVYYAAVDLLTATNSAVTAINNVYKYDAVLYYKQFSPHSDPNEYVKDVDLAQYKASESVILLSAWDLKSLVDGESVTQIAVVPCIQRNNYFECLPHGHPIDPLPWTAILTNTEGIWSVTFVRCGYIRGPTTKLIIPDPVFYLPEEPSLGDYYVSVKLNTETGEPDGFLCSQTPSEVYDTSPPTDEFFKKLLYSFTYRVVPASDPVAYEWVIKDGWYRLMPELGAYV